MRYFLDTEFNGFGGELISLAMVPEFGDQEFYAVLPLPDALHPWVERHVVPFLGQVPDWHRAAPTSRVDAAAAVAQFLAGDREPVIVADWPDDIAYFCTLIVTANGEIATVGSLTFRFLSTPGFSTSANSRVPHNALHDARALRDFVLGWES